MARSLTDLLTKNVTERPVSVALRFGDKHWSWVELQRCAASLAALLHARDVVAGDRVVLVGKNSPGYFVALFGCARLGAIFVPLNWRLTSRELAVMIADCEAPVVIADGEFAELADLAIEVAGRSPGQTLRLSTGPLAEPPCEGDRGAAPDSVADSDAVAFQLYTSGTTGRPKGAMFANGSFVTTLLDKVSGAWGFSDADVSLVCMPLSHMGGLAWALAGMARGAETVIVREFDPVAVLETCARERVTTSFFVPAMISALLEVEGVAARSDLTLRRLTYSGAPIAPSVLQKATRTFHCGFVQIYGLTETTAFTQLDPEDHDPRGPREHLLRSAGRPYPWVEVMIVETESGAEQPPGAAGEIWTRSSQLFVGYFKREDETALALTEDGWLPTGDVGYFDDERYLYLLDRRKDMIISGGENVYPAEVEGALADYPPVLEVAVVGVPSERWGETVKAVVVPRPGNVVHAQELIAFARTRMAKFKCPTSVDVVETLPHTATGKIQRNVVREPYWAGYDRRIN